ncbi:hypothetical protein [Mycobacterium deserti]|uniref:Secreted protein n=1 Tax=Mycobacterium deserti TaxID=2978347 RepID=A0ABT2M9T6_9MYCO|nr:hypothetical protein [Mycobacterium deserti]MCT7659023.1 hypothetical protein [Mycobacterium deserti]
MMRVVAAVGAAMVLTGLVGAGVAHAGPPPPCSFTLSPPQIVHVDGAPVVTATMAPGACGFPADPYSSVACVRILGVDSAGQCSQGRGAQPAQVFYAPYRPGAVYESTGRGCGRWSGNLPAPDCQLLGPFAATL